MVVDRLSALEDLRTSAKEADGERNTEESNSKEELKRLGERILKLEESETAEQEVQICEDKINKEEIGAVYRGKEDLGTVYSKMEAVSSPRLRHATL